ncbi:MAG: transposase [Bacteroidales bacterium]
MANVYYQSTVQLIFAVRKREALITPDFKITLLKYISGFLMNQDHKPLAVNCVADHLHILFGMRPCDIPALVNDLKSDSSEFVNRKKLSRFHFQWQDSYGFFTYHLSDRKRMIRYVENQERHHYGKTFREEYVETLKDHDIEYNEKYLFDFFE